ncbi:hypothetical protein DPMN_101890 [Dreissena polymorpha]|uniref:Mab-21-like HhH/H2TH-like domain-containing protein n=1 Tax=Dreissena polymorpha TaxID=45954 RepID=A0A9D4LJU7_DREPO|nr:hypothetical protein DPMN_101890 [Dreissena polymorpha]
MATDSVKELSMKLSEVMEDIGVTEELIDLRRYTYSLNETIARGNITCTLFGLYHIVGSQIEGSTTLGMKSDNDEVVCNTSMIAVLDWSERRNLMHTLLVVKTPLSFPQCCSLQILGQISGFPFNTYRAEEQFLYDQKGRKMLSNKRFLQQIILVRLYMGKRCEQNGPAITTDNRADLVLAMYCPSLHDDCLTWMTRPRPGHWPKQETLKQAKQCGMFLVHPGMIRHYFSHDSVRGVGYMDKQFADEYASAQWRMSIYKIEQLLLFDLNLVQMKTLILLKRVRKEFLKEILEDRLSTFHMKTTLLFTVEQYPEDIWRNDNLVKCVLYCLNTVRRFLKRRICPHYTVDHVNLFSLKLKVHEFAILINTVTALINSNLQCVCNLRMDNIGNRLSANPDGKLSTRKGSRLKIVLDLIWESRVSFMIAVYNNALLTTQHFEYVIEQWRDFFADIRNENEYSSELLLYFETTSCILASLQASKCIENRQHITDDIARLYTDSLVSGQIPLLLKYASMLVCTKRFEGAEAILEKIEMMIKPDMFQFAVKVDDSGRISELDSDETTHRSTSRENYLKYVSKAIFPVEFTRHEINSAPFFLQYEMHRTITPDDDIARRSFKGLLNWMDCVVSDAKPFLYYLQFLASKSFEKQEEAFLKLESYCNTILRVVINECQGNECQGHFETALNMFGHVLELEHNKPLAWYMYTVSIRWYAYNNAAYWHLFRLLGNYVYKETNYLTMLISCIFLLNEHQRPSPNRLP